MHDKSGSCALIVLFVGEDIYIANVGDCRAVLSEHNGTKITNLSVDHKPFDEK
jgi:serine/threonine protein phosphatase PrpC